MKKVILLLLLLVLPLQALADGLPRLHVEENRLETPDEDSVTLRGVSLCSTSYNDPKNLLATLANRQNGWNVDVVRLPVQPSEWGRIGADRYVKDYLDPAVRECRVARFYCIIDWHEVADWQGAQVTQALESFWRKVAPRYKDDPFILYEVFNEPRNPGDQTLENWRKYRARAQQWIDEIRKAAPETVLLIGSPRWSQMAGFAAWEPLSGRNLVYTFHLYHGSPRDEWDVLFGNASEKIPVFVSEWGWSSLLSNRPTPFYGTRKDFAEPVKAYLDGHPQISWTAWSFDPACGPAMRGNDREMGEFVRAWLRELHAGNARSGAGFTRDNASVSSRGRG